MMKRIAFAMLVAFFLGGAFLVYSFASSFMNWPWTTTEVATMRHPLGFTVGASKDTMFDVLMARQRNGDVDVLELLDEHGITDSQRFRSVHVAVSDRPRVTTSDKWHVGLAEKNTWVVLSFFDDTLTLIEEHRYRGPSE